MSDSSFVGYVGDADFHDGSILSVERRDGTVRVRVRRANGSDFIAEFIGVTEIKAFEPEGMILYALSETNFLPPLRRFVFANWDDESISQLEVMAVRLNVIAAEGM